MVCTPEYVEDMVIGYLASERVIRSFEDIEEIWHQEKRVLCILKQSILILITNRRKTSAILRLAVG